MVTHDPRSANTAKRNIRLLDGIVAEDLELVGSV